MKAIITKIFSWFKNLFLKLRVVVTLQCGREKLVTKEDDDGETVGKENDNEDHS